MTLFEVEAKKFGEPAQELKGDLEAGVQQVSAYSKAGGQILFGTDVGYTDAYDTTEEYRQLGRALDWRQILKALTTAPAQRFGYTATKADWRPAWTRIWSYWIKILRRMSLRLLTSVSPYGRGTPFTMRRRSRRSPHNDLAN